tara:strand:+ start:1213 stop:3780 length:2568 start_codon:yes stop_codon:yes gene_type:complete
MGKYQSMFDLIDAPKETVFGKYFKTFTGYRDKVLWKEIENQFRQRNFDQKELSRLYRDLVKQKHDLIREQSLLVVTGQRSEDSRVRSLAASSQGAMSAVNRHEQDMFRIRLGAEERIRTTEDGKYNKAIEDHQKIFNNSQITRAIQVSIRQLGNQRNFTENTATINARVFKGTIAGGVPLNSAEGAAAIDLMYRALAKSDGGVEYADMWYQQLRKENRPEIGGIPNIDKIRYKYYLDSNAGSGWEKAQDDIDRQLSDMDKGSPSAIIGSGVPSEREGITNMLKEGSNDPIRKQYDNLEDRLNDIDAEIKKVEEKREALGSTGGLLNLGNGDFAQNWITDNPFTRAPAWVEAFANTVAGAIETPKGKRQVNEMFDILSEHENPSEALEWSINNQWPPPPGITEDLEPDRAEGILEESAIAEEAGQPTALVAYGDTESARGIRDFLAKFEQDVDSGTGLPWNELSQKIDELKESGNEIGVGIANSIERSLINLDQTGDMNRFMDDLSNVSSSQAETLVEEQRVSRERKEVEQAGEQVEIPSFIKSKLGLPGAGSNLQDTVEGLDSLLRRFNLLQADPNQNNPGREAAIARLTDFRSEFEAMGKLRDPLLGWRTMSFDERKGFADNLLFLTQVRHEDSRRNISELREDIELSVDLPVERRGLEGRLRGAVLEEDQLVRELSEAQDAVEVLGGIAESFAQVGQRPIPGGGVVADLAEDRRVEVEKAVEPVQPVQPTPSLEDDIFDAWAQSGTIPEGYQETPVGVLWSSIALQQEKIAGLQKSLDEGTGDPQALESANKDLQALEGSYNTKREEIQATSGGQSYDLSFFLEQKPITNPELLRDKPLVLPFSDDDLLLHSM